MVLIIVVRLVFSLKVFEKLEGKKIRISAVVLQEPSRFSNYQKFYLEGLKIYLPRYPQVNYGDRLTVEGIVENKKLINAKLIKVSQNENILLEFRKKIISFYQTNFPQPYSSLVAGITLGYKPENEGFFWEQLKSTGTMHVVVASGMNVTFVAGFLMSIFLNFMPRKKAIVPVLCGIWLYAFISGFEAPIVRSAIMASIAFMAQFLGRVSYTINALFLSALLMLLAKPIWIYDLGFILSFVSTSSLIIFTKKIEKLIGFLPKYIKTNLTTTLAAQIGVAPILLVTFGEFNLFSPIINALILWTVPLIMVIGSISGLIGIVIPSLGRLILYISYPLTWYFVSVINIFKGV